jgi:ATP-dependent RNA helicase DDX5/DBP2
LLHCLALWAMCRGDLRNEYAGEGGYGGGSTYGRANSGKGGERPSPSGDRNGGSSYGKGGASNYGDSGGSRWSSGSNGWGDSTSGAGGGNGWEEDWSGEKFSDLGANLKDIDWSTEKLEQKGSVSGQYQKAASARTPAEVAQWRKEKNITVSGRDPANPILTFEETGFPQYMLDSFKKQGFKTPSDIQSQGWGPAMAGRDMVGVAKTGSGKTLAFGIPGLLNIAAQPKLQPGDGPLMLVLAPTRELGQQIDQEFRKVLPSELRAACIYGGAPKWDQKKELQWGVHALVATPGRLIDFIESGVTNLRRVTYLVLDEADRMLDMGFEPDVRKIVSQIRPDRQTLMWSATWPKSVQRLARDFQKDIVHIQVGSDELSTNKDITQQIKFTYGYSSKMDQLKNTLWELEREGVTKMIMFAGTKKGCEELSNQIRQMGYKAGAIHGDKSQDQREKALWNLKSMNKYVLVATDVASRGIDIPKLPAVLNFDMPEQLEDYVHRIGRTGRAGQKGLAISFFTPSKDCGHAKGLIDLLSKAGQEVPHELHKATTMTPPEKVYYGRGSKGGKGGGKGGKGKGSSPY